MQSLKKNIGLRVLGTAGAPLILGRAILALGCLAHAQAGSFTNALVTHQNTSLFEQVTVNAPDLTPAAIIRQGADYLVQAQTSYGANHTLSSTALTPNNVAYASSIWELVFDLTGAAPGTPVILQLGINYDVFFSLGSDGFAGWVLEVNNQRHVPLATTNNPFGQDQCAVTRPLAGTRPGACNGGHVGVLNLFLPYAVGTGHILRVSTNSATAVAGLSDALNTAVVTGITVPDGIGWNYSDIAGNPLNFHYASVSSDVPEPASFGLAGLGFAALLLRRTLRVKMR